MRSWGIAGAFGVLAFLLLLGKGFGAALLLGVLTFVLLGLVLNWLFCASVPEATSAATPAPKVTPREASTTAQAAAAGTAGTAGAAVAETTASSPTETAADSTPAEPEPAAPAAEPAAASSPEEAPKLKPSTPLAGEAELAGRKGTWKYTKPESAAPAPAPEPAPDPVAASGQAAPRESAAPAPTASEGPKLKPSTPLAGQAELAERRGSWKYEKDGPKAGAAASETEDFDGDGTYEGTDEGEKPALLDGPRGGQPDDLKEIKGIGPKLEKMCHAMGVYHFDQIAAWTDQEVAWVDANLQGFKGRVSRDDWRAQAKILASGGETEFSERVEKGGVY